MRNENVLVRSNQAGSSVWIEVGTSGSRGRLLQWLLTACLTFGASASALAQTTTTTTLPGSGQQCITDVQGADDEPGQKDLNEFCKQADDGTPFEVRVGWNFDDVSWSGNNTGDACALFDTNGNGFADFALCVTIEDGPPATMQAGSPRLFMCGDDRPDRCTNGVEDTDGFDSQCTVNDPSEGIDPFASDPDHMGSNACGGTDCSTEDAHVDCWLEAGDLPGDETCNNNACANMPARFCVVDADCLPITDVCSYPSNQPNSDPSDCIITPTAQDPCKNVDCSYLDDECNVGVCIYGVGECTTEPLSAGTACGDATDATCDAPDTCDGAGTCQPNYASDQTECRASAGECDVAEFCDGAGSCPDDGFASAGTACGDATDTVCDGADTCDGSGSCQPNYSSDQIECRASAGECDVAEFCDGAGSCPDDGFASAGTACGDATDTVCDGADTCDGSGSCQPNYSSDQIECRASGGECDVAETCDGAGSCPDDAFEPAGTACGDASDTVCDNPDSCDGSGQCLPNHEPGTTVCREDAGQCDVAETCDGAGSCPDDAFEPAGTACGDGSDTVCDNPDSCDGSGQCLPNYEPNTTVCREDAGQCDVAELCDGNGSCPEQAYEPDGTPCDDGQVCTGPDTCTAGVCSGDPIQPQLTVIKQVVNETRGTLEANDFRLNLFDGVSDNEFRVDLDPNDPTIGTKVFDVDHGTHYEVTELLGDLADYYAVSYEGDCVSTASCENPDPVCTVVNHDIYRNQASIAYQNVTVGYLPDDDSHTRVEGQFTITDESEPGDQPDGWIILLDDYEMDWEFRSPSATDWEPYDEGDQNGGSLQINGETVNYLCVYDVLDVDGNAFDDPAYQSGDPVLFDEVVTIGYLCEFDQPLPDEGVIRGISTTGIFAKSGFEFHSRRSMSTDGTMYPPESSDPSDPRTCEDPNGDGSTSASDALLIMHAAVGMMGPDGQPPRCPLDFCDQTCDGRISAPDALVALSRSVGLGWCPDTGCSIGPKCCQ
jgi:hypothetical protein